jgi:hypothetical protein
MAAKNVEMKVNNVGSPCSCAIVLQHDHQAVVCQGNQTDRDHVEVCQGEGIAIPPTALPPPPLLSVDHVGISAHFSLL